MSEEHDKKALSFYSKIQELLELYKNVKHFILLSEYYNSYSLPLAPINELRNALDHIMRASDPENNDFENEIKKAEGHIFRAGFDVCEIIAIDRINFLHDFIRKFSYQSIIRAFPDYDKEITPLITETKIKLADTRAIDDNKKRLYEYEKIIDLLLEKCDKLESIQSEIVSFQEKENFKKLFQTRNWTVFLGLIVFSAIIIAYSAQLADINMTAKSLSIFSFLTALSVMILLLVFKKKGK